MFTTQLIANWRQVKDGETLSFSQSAPVSIRVRCHGPVALTMETDEGSILVGSGASGEFAVDLREKAPKALKVHAKSGALAAVCVSVMGHTQTKLTGDIFTVHKSRVVMSDDMRMMQHMMRQQARDFEDRLNALQKNTRGNAVRQRAAEQDAPSPVVDEDPEPVDPAGAPDA